MKMHLLPISPNTPVLSIIIFSSISLADGICAPSHGCPACGMDYSPFKPWFTYYNDTSQTCWNTITCVLLQSDETRKQQHTVIALIMGLVPLALKDVSWPERRTIPLSMPLPKMIEILVRTLSLEPESITFETEGHNAARQGQVQGWWRQRSIAQWAWKDRQQRPPPARTSILLSLLSLSLAICYAALALVEIYSKRAVLGCPYPIFVLSWHLFAIVPAAIHTACAAYRASRKIDGAAKTSWFR